jgi:pyruvate dehydrogenase E1 component
MKNLAPTDAAALEAVETREWIESLDYVLHQGDKARVVRLLEALRARARVAGVRVPFGGTTPYVNTIAADEQVPIPGDGALERRIKSLVRWNALAMVVRGNRESDGIGGHISTFASSATLYEVGFNHFFRGRTTAARPTSCSTRATRRRASTPVRSSRAACPRRTCATSAAN